MDADCMGMEVGGFILGTELGHGALATVYRGQSLEDGHDYAIKILNADRSKDARIVDRFHVEGRLTERLNHPTVIKCLDMGVDDGIYYQVYPWYRRGDGQDALRHGAGRFAVSEAVRLLRPIAEALTLLEQWRIVHRDIKPSNILLAEGGGGVLADFGLALIEGYPPPEGMPVGTAAYCSPEQLTRLDVDQRSDFYSWGVTLFRLLSGHLPFDFTNQEELIRAILHQPFPDIDQHCGPLPAGLRDLLQSCCARDPELRPQSARQLVSILAGLETEIFRQQTATLRINGEATLSAAPPAPLIQLQESSDHMQLFAEVAPGIHIEPEVWHDLIAQLPASPYLNRALLATLEQHGLSDCSRLLLGTGAPAQHGFCASWVTTSGNDDSEASECCPRPVCRGEVIAHWRGGSVGQAGATVLGDPLLPLAAGHWLTARAEESCGLGVLLHHERGRYFLTAAHHGYLIAGPGSVAQVLPVREYTDGPACGELVDPGRALVVHGGAAPGARMSSPAGVVVFGAVTNAHIDSGGDIIVCGDCMGPRTRLRAWGAIIITGNVGGGKLYGNSVRVHGALNDVQVVANAEVSADSISGGEVRSGGMVMAHRLGSPQGAATMIHAGDPQLPCWLPADADAWLRHQRHAWQAWRDDIKRQYRAMSQRSRRLQRAMMTLPVDQHPLAATLQRCERALAAPYPKSSSVPPGITAGAQIYQGVTLQLAAEAVDWQQLAAEGRRYDAQDQSLIGGRRWVCAAIQ